MPDNHGQRISSDVFFYHIHMMRLTVGRNDEDYQTIQEALDAVPYLEEAEVLISEGVYEEKLFSDKDNLTVRGLGHVVITNSDGANEIVGNRKRGTFRSYTAFFSGRKLVLENLTIENRAGSGVEAGQAIALYLDVREALLGHVRLFGHQDTLFLSPLPEKEREKGGFYGPRYRSPRVMCRSVIRNSCIEGDIDFIFGSGDALFDNCEIRSNGKGWIAAPSGRSDGIGFVFNNCCFTSVGAADDSVYLMRPWRREGKACFISSCFSSHIRTEGLAPWPGLETEIGDCTFSICRCTGKEIGGGLYEISPDKAEKVISLF